MIELLPDLVVSRETEGSLRQLEALLSKWNPAINLVSKSTMPTAWSRHILDSAQLFALAGPFRKWADLGSGGGFPGLVIAILGRELQPAARLTLIESDQRKATFLRQAAREIGVDVIVRSERIENAEPAGADVVSARALAPLDVLCGLALRHLAEGGVALFPKGVTWEDEVAAARKSWNFECSARPSVVDESSVVLVMKAINHV